MRYEWFKNRHSSQFHYGSIKTKVLLLNEQDKFLSQFHYGSIKTKWFANKNSFEGNLNSTMVRLKLSWTNE